jgi:opacity protein-like surface antigen
MKKTLFLIAVLVVLLPALAFSDMMTIRLGYYMPNALRDSYIFSHPDSLFGIEFTQMSLRPTDFRGSILGGGYEFFLNPYLSAAVSVDFFSRENGGYYLDYVGLNFTDGDYAAPYALYGNNYDFEIRHSFNISMTPVQLSLKLTPLGRKTRLIPYIGGGIGAYFLHARISGDIVDFSQEYVYADPDLGDVTVYPVTYTNASETKLVLGGHAFAGLMFPIGYRLTLEAEARYHYAKATFTDAFQGYDKFDLSGLSLSIGLNYWF